MPDDQARLLQFLQLVVEHLRKGDTETAVVIETWIDLGMGAGHEAACLLWGLTKINMVLYTGGRKLTKGPRFEHYADAVTRRAVFVT